MRLDELNQPLRKRSLFSRLWEKRPGMLFCAYVLAFSGMGAGGWWAMQQKNPFAGEPVVMVSVPPAQEIATASTEPAPESTETEQVADAPAETDVASADAVVEEPAPESDDAPALRDDYPQEAAIVVTGRRALAPSPQIKITETTSWGPLPRVSGDGSKASVVYARTTSKNILHSDSPKIALLLGGMGLNKKLTQKAIKDLPADITLAFAPYGNELQEQVDKARKEGHEVFLQVPLEPVGYPATNPGPKTLVGDGSEAENIDSLRWHMSRFHGYAGIVNYMGGRFLAMPKAMKPMLNELKQRGVFFLEDGSMALSSTETAAKLTKTQVRRAKVVIDSTPTPQAIISALTLLEEQATGTGLAIGTGSGLEVTIDTVRDWAKAAAERGIILVPISAAYKGQQG
jgi:uncharacterized protein